MISTTEVPSKLYRLLYIVAAHFPCRETGGFFLPMLTVIGDNDWQVQFNDVPPNHDLRSGGSKNKKEDVMGCSPVFLFSKLSLM